MLKEEALEGEWFGEEVGEGEAASERLLLLLVVTKMNLFIL